MPQRDGTGPRGFGFAQGRARSAGANMGRNATAGLMLGLGCGAAMGLGHRFGKRKFMQNNAEVSRKEILEQQKQALQCRLDSVIRELEIENA